MTHSSIFNGPITFRVLSCAAVNAEFDDRMSLNDLERKALRERRTGFRYAIGKAWAAAMGRAAR